MDPRVRLEVDGAIATITNDAPDTHNAFDDAMDATLWEILAELGQRTDVRAIIWRAARSPRGVTSGRSAAGRSTSRTTS